MYTIYLYCALIGGVVLAVQTLLTILGISTEGLDGVSSDQGGIEGGTHTDVSVDHGSALFLKILTLKSLVAFLTFFGLAGLAASGAGWSRGGTLFAAIGAGVAAVFAIAHMIALLSKLHASGSTDLANAVGVTGRVYLRVPASNSGYGKVHVTVQGRTAEIKAQTNGPELPTGAQARVVRLLGTDTVEVVSAEA